ncbi:MAG TPA: PEP/pyruvate-binding domain-containing protein, partial [Polyangiaceae bacterium]
LICAACGGKPSTSISGAAGASGAANLPSYVCEWNEDGRPEELARLGCPRDHERLAGVPVAAALPASRSVMFVVEREQGNRLHFFDSLRWRHFTFAQERLTGYEDFSVFNAEMYYRPERRLFLGTLTYYLAPQLYAVEISPIDKAGPDLIAEIFGVVQSSLAWSAQLAYHPTSNALEMPERLPPNVPVIDTEDLYRGATFQAMHVGHTVGRVHVTSLAKLAGEYIDRRDIVVLDHVPNDLPMVAGLATAEFQTPLSHVNLLSQNRGTPNMALLGATTDRRFVDRDGQWVDFTVRADGFDLVPSTSEAAEAYWQEQRPKEPQVARLDLSPNELVDATDLDLSWTPRVGGKAANFGELTHIVPALPLPTAFAVPCSFYVSFMQANGLSDLLTQMLQDPSFVEDVKVRQQKLATLRSRILAAPVDSGLVASIATRADALFGKVPTRLRSSSNVEDLTEFNGAGLYESHTFDPTDTSSNLAMVLKRVWASLWNLGAFEERDWARIDQTSAAMGVLVHRSFPDAIEAANGVAITANPFDPPPDGQAAHYINVQPGANSVSNPDPSFVPESMLYYKPPAGQGEMTYLSHSSLNGGEPVLSFQEIVSLVKSLEAIHEHYSRVYRGEARLGMDVEFKFVMPSRSLVIKQARRYPFR